MPLNEFGVEDPLKTEIKGPLLERARNFAGVVERAQKWEADNEVNTLTGSIIK